MRRMSNTFYKELHELRSCYGDKEYSRNEILPAAMSLVSKHLKDESELLRDATTSILDNIEKQDDRSESGLFDYDEHVALGGTKRIKRGAMNAEQLRRRKKLIDTGKIAQDVAWANETKWLDIGIDALEGHPLTTKRSDVLDESGNSKAVAA